MEPETINSITYWLTLITMLVAFAGSIIIIGRAALESLRNKVVRWDMLLYVIVILWSLPWGIRDYGPALVDATVDLLHNLTIQRPEIEEAVRAFVGETVGTPKPDSYPTAVFTPTPLPNITPAPNMFELTATAYFGDFPTALPANTPTPEYTATWSMQDFEAQATVNAAGNPTVAPTRFICRTIEDIKAGCQPPTPPGN